MRTVEAVRERQKKMASAEMASRRVWRESRRRGAVVQVFIVRGGRVIERVELLWASKAGHRRHRGSE